MAKPSSKAQHTFVEAYRAGLMQALGARAAAHLSADEIYAGAMAVAARVDRGIERMQRAGELKAVNTSYRDYRLGASARGEKVLRYADWIDRYKANLIREIAAIRIDEIVDDLQRQYFPKEFQDLAYEGARRGTVND